MDTYRCICIIFAKVSGHFSCWSKGNLGLYRIVQNFIHFVDIVIIFINYLTLLMSEAFRESEIDCQNYY